jgi:hypothetical protein
MTTNHGLSWQADAMQRVATVRAVEGAAVSVAFEDGEVGTARRAVSCLVAPMPGDTVLLALSPRGVHLLAVLERDAGAAVRVEADGDLELRSVRGRVALRGPAGVDVLSAAAVRVAAPEVAVEAGRGRLVAEALVVCGATLDARFVTTRAALDAVDLTALRVATRTRWSFRHVEESDHLRAGRIDHAAETTLCLRAEHAVVHAESLVKMDGQQIHLG